MGVQAIQRHPRPGRVKPAAARARARHLLRRGMWRAADGDPEVYEQVARWWLAGW